MPSPIRLAALLALALAACRGQGPPASHPSAPVPPAVPIDAAGAAFSLEPPFDYLEMSVVGVVPEAQGGAVLLTDAAHEMILPIVVGSSEALSIQLRFKKRRYERPLTHDLFDSVLRELGGELLKVQVDDVKDNVFVGTVFLRHGGRLYTVDARPSDAIALALGNQAPIFVSRRVVSRAAIRKDKLAPDRPGHPPSLPPRPESTEPPPGTQRL